MARNSTSEFIARLQQVIKDKNAQNGVLLETLDRKDATIKDLEDELASSGDARYAKQQERIKRMELELTNLRAQLRSKPNV